MSTVKVNAAYTASHSDLIIHLLTTGEIIALNTQAANFFSWHPHEVVNQIFFEKLLPHHRKVTITATHFAKMQSDQTISYKFKTAFPDKKMHELQWMIHCFDFSGLPQISKFYSLIGRDITDGSLPCGNETTPTEVKDALANLDSIIACMPGSVYWKDIKGVYRGCNDVVVKMAGLQSRQDIIGKTDYDFADMGLWGPNGHEIAESFRNTDLEVMRTGKEKLNFEEPPFLLANGQLIYQLDNKVPLRDGEGNIIGIVGVGLDITERKRLAEELKHKQDVEAANKAKSEFLAIISHELRTPLTGILGMAELLKNSKLTAAARNEYLHTILQSGSYLLSLINSILDFARLEAGKFELSSSPIDLKVLIEEVTLMLGVQAKAKGLELLISYQAGVPNKIIADSRALRQIIINLVGNAIKFTREGYILISVHCLEQSVDTAKLEISVKDTGLGMPADKLEQIFEHFKQLDDPSYTGGSEGTGLGLSICRSLVELMNGAISVKSQVGLGSEFLCTIDFLLQSNAIAQLPWAQYEASVRVLIIDDTARAEVIRKQISQSNCQVSSGAEALNILISAQALNDGYRVVIIDQNLSSADPYQLLRIINARNSLLKPMPLLLAANGSLRARKAAANEGFFSVLIKPIQPIELQTQLTTAWEKWVEKHALVYPTAPLYSPKILVVEDNKVAQKVHKKLLEKLHCHVTIAENAEQTYQRLSQKYDLIFLDVGLPDVSGYEIAKEIRKREAASGKARTPIIALTGYDDEEHKEAALKAGMDAVRVKPVNLEELKGLLMFWVGNLD
jgi:two-component system sensor histidine kinase/response regulator